ncbi:MAG: UDP-3-O-(3-hydroxymyristoyl)glucosamine N-acyltransferase [Cyanobacteriota bacterium]
MKKEINSFELSKIADTHIIGNEKILLQGVCDIKSSKNNFICLLYEKKYYSHINNSATSCFLVSEDFDYKKYPEYTFLVSKNPKFSLIKILSFFKENYNFKKEISNLAYVSENAKIAKTAIIKEFVHIGNNVTIEDNVTIFPNVFIGDNSYIDENTIIYPNVSILLDSKIGKNVIINANSVIGSDGYGFAQDKNNNHHKIPQIGNVIIENDVEIGSGVCIDRGVFGSTIIKQGTKIDNLVHIAHNVKIGERNLLIAQSGIAGSTLIGNDCIIAGQSGISGHIELGDKTYVFARSGVTKNFNGGKISGFPARNHEDELKNQVLLRKMDKTIEYIKKLEERIFFLETSLNNDKI